MATLFVALVSHVVTLSLVSSGQPHFQQLFISRCPCSARLDLSQTITQLTQLS